MAKLNVHDGGGMAFGGGQVDEATLAKQVEPSAVGGLVFLNEGAHFAVTHRHGLQRRYVDFDVEVAAVGNNRASGITSRCACR